MLITNILKNIFGSHELLKDSKDDATLIKMYEPFKIAQRFLALLIGIPYVILLSVGCILLFFGINVEEAKTGINLVNENLGFPFTLVLGFYFAGGMAEGIIEKYKKPEIKSSSKHNKQAMAQ